MTDSHAPEAGWYDDPDMALRLRWWDGERWTKHTRPRPIVEHPAEQAITGHVSIVGSANTGSTVIAAPVSIEPYGYSAPYSWSPGSATSPEFVHTQTHETVIYEPESSTTPAAWALALTPLVTALAQAAAAVLSGFESTPFIWIVGAAIIPVLWIIIWVRRDLITLHEWGFMRRAHWAWAFLGDLGYMTARTLVVRRQTGGRGWWPLVTNLALTAILVNVGLFTPILSLLRDTVM